MRAFVPAGVQRRDALWRSSRRGDALDFTVGSCEHDYIVAAPARAAIRFRVAQRLRRASRRCNPLQFPLRKKAQIPAVRGPEGKRDLFGPRQAGEPKSNLMVVPKAASLFLRAQ